jgi:hypothetical protein
MHVTIGALALPHAIGMQTEGPDPVKIICRHRRVSRICTNRWPRTPQEITMNATHVTDARPAVTEIMPKQPNRLRRFDPALDLYS